MIEHFGIRFCVCGLCDFTSALNFWPCRPDGTPVDPWVEDYQFWTCPRCGVIFHDQTLEIVGVRALENVTSQREVIQQTLKRFEPEKKEKETALTVSSST